MRIEENDKLMTVYNLTVSDYHTFFVSGPGWGFSVWVHNQNLCEAVKELAFEYRKAKEDLFLNGNEVAVQAARQKVNDLLAKATAEDLQKALSGNGGRGA